MAETGFVEQNVDAGLVSELPPARSKHWTPRQKAAVVAAVQSGTLTLGEACERYMLTGEEFQSWKEALDQAGVAGLRLSARPERRSAQRELISEPATAVLHSGERVDCLITDIGDHGARLMFTIAPVLPNTFELQCAKSGRSWWVCPIWNRGQIVGVRFDNPLPPPWTIKSGLGGWLLGRRRTVAIDRISPL
jgi:hypothetical protein